MLCLDTTYAHIIVRLRQLKLLMQRWMLSSNARVYKPNSSQHISYSHLQLPTEEIVTTSKGSQRDCNCHMQASHSCLAENEAPYQPKPSLMEHYHNSVCLRSSRLKPVFIFMLVVYLFQCAVLQAFAEPTTRTPNRCLSESNNSCTFSFYPVEYRYNLETGECDSYLCHPSDNNQFNSFSTLEECRNTCIGSKLHIL